MTLTEHANDLDRALVTGRRELLRILAERIALPSTDRKARARLRAAVDAQAELLRNLEAQRNACHPQVTRN